MRAPRPTTLLLVSVALNLFLMGALGVFLYRQSQKAPAVAPPLAAAVAGLTREHKASFHTLLRAEGVRLKPIMHDAKLARREAARLFAAPDLDRAKVLDALARARANENNARAELEEQVVDFAAPLSAEERGSLSIILRRGVKTNRRTLGGAGAPTAVGKRNVPK
jgi:uncharacterized membrane protein